jgi:MarR family transcriptional regulator for hemolysin
MLTNIMAKLDPEQIGLLLNDTWRAWRAKLDGRLKPLGLSQGKWRTLVHLSKSADHLSQSELAARMAIEEPTLVGLLRRLEADGWIKRRGASHDRRCKTVRLASKSNAVLPKILGTARKLRHELIADVSTRDLQTCMQVLTRIRKRAEGTDVNGNGRRSAKRQRST